MKRLTLPLLMLLSPAALANWTLQSFPAFSEPTSGLFTSQATLGQRPTTVAAVSEPTVLAAQRRG